MAIAFAIPAIVGQNFGAQQFDRVKQTFKYAVMFNTLIMLMLTAMIHIQPEWFVNGFTEDKKVIEFGSLFLVMISWNFVPSGMIMICSGMFQGIGNTWPALLSTATRLLTFAIPAIWLSMQQNFEIIQIWRLSVVTVFLQSLLSYWLIKHQFKTKCIKSNRDLSPQII